MAIRQAILEVCKGTCEEDMKQFAGYLVLDAVIGNTERHHENWALLRRESKEGVTYRLAPSFDHASSLGREMRDARRLLILRDNRLDAYIHGGPGAIYLTISGEKAVCPLDLVRILAQSLPDPFLPWVRALEGVTSDRVDTILNRFPDGWISGAQRQFAALLISRTVESLTALTK